MRSSWLASAILAGCYQPHASPGIACAPGGACPAGQMCVVDICVLDGTQPIDAPPVSDGALDATPMIDAPIPVDAPLDAALDAAPPVDAAPIPIAWKSTTTAMVDPATPATSITVVKPTCPANNLLVAAIAMGNTGQPVPPTFTAPSGWTLVRRLDRGPDSGLGVYWHVTGAAEPATYTWQLSVAIEGVAWISCYTGVDTTAPIAAEMGIVDQTVGPGYVTPSVITNRANSMLVAAFAAHATMTPTTWTSTTVLRANLNNGDTRSGAGTDKLFAGVGATGTLNATASVAQNYALIELVALNPP